jgi:hypothetical protein
VGLSEHDRAAKAYRNGPDDRISLEKREALRRVRRVLLSLWYNRLQSTPSPRIRISRFAGTKRLEPKIAIDSTIDASLLQVNPNTNPDDAYHRVHLEAIHRRSSQ